MTDVPNETEDVANYILLPEVLIIGEFKPMVTHDKAADTLMVQIEDCPVTEVWDMTTGLITLVHSFERRTVGFRIEGYSELKKCEL